MYSYNNNFKDKARNYIKRFWASFYSIFILLFVYIIIAFLAYYKIDILKNEEELSSFILIMSKTFIALGLLIIYAGCMWMTYRWLRRPVERDRFLFAHSDGGMIIYSILVVAIILCYLFTLADLLNVNSSDLISRDFLSDDYPEDSLLWSIICQFADPGNLPQSLSKGMGVAIISAIAGIVCLAGLIVSSFVNYITLRTEQWKRGQIRYKRGFDKYVVIIGVNEQTATIVKKSLKRSEVNYVLIQTSKNVEKERAKLELMLDHSEEERVVFYYGERTLDEDIYSLHLEKAIEIYILGEDMNYPSEEDHDSFNMKCLEIISKYMKSISQYNKRIRCHVNFEYQSTFAIFKATHLYRSLNDDKIEFLPFNLYEIWAKKVLVDCCAIIPSGKMSEKKVIDYHPLDSYWYEDENKNKTLNYIQEDVKKTVHLVIIGMNQMGMALATQAALLVHLPNYQKDKSKKMRTTITFIDNNAVKESEYLMGRYQALFSLCRHRTIVCSNASFNKDYCKKDKEKDPYNIMWQHTKNDKSVNYIDWDNPMDYGPYSYIGKKMEAKGLDSNFMDIQWEFIEGNVASKDVQDYLSALSEDLEHRTCTIAVCLNNPQQSIATALYLPETVLRRALQVLVYQHNTFDMIDKVATTEKEWKRYEKLIPFGIIEDSYTGEGYDSTLAMFANILYDKDSAKPKGDDKSNYDESFKKYCFRARRLWDELGIVYKMSNIDLIDSFNLKLRSAGNKYKEQVALLSNSEKQKYKYISMAEHNRWMTERLTMGYRPLFEDELEKLLNKEDDKYEFSKEYYKEKNRAHLDICPIELIKEMDKEVHDRDNDGVIISMMLAMLEWQQRAIILNVERSSTNAIKDSSVLQMVPVNSLWVGKRPVTVGQWRAVMGCAPQKMDEKGRYNESAYVNNVSYNDIQRFLRILRNNTKLPFDLPLEDERKGWFKYRTELEDIDGKIWQWTKTHDSNFLDSYLFFGQKKSYNSDDWENNSSYWLPDFKSDKLGFRLVLRCEFPLFEMRKLSYDLKNDDYKVMKYDLKQQSVLFDEDDDKVIKDLIGKGLVKIDGNEKPFYIMNTPVTQRQWKAVMRNIAKKPWAWVKENPAENRGDYLPIENVSYKEAKIFCEELEKKYKKLEKEWNIHSIVNLKFRLPTKQEWLMAANSGKADQSMIWHNKIARSTHKVKRPAEAGKDKIYDMFGNVWEWCQDSSESGRGKDYEYMMGGSWRFPLKNCLNKEEGKFEPGISYWVQDYKADDLGFRIIVEGDDIDKLISDILSLSL